MARGTAPISINTPDRIAFFHSSRTTNQSIKSSQTRKIGQYLPGRIQHFSADRFFGSGHRYFSRNVMESRSEVNPSGWLDYHKANNTRRTITLLFLLFLLEGPSTGHPLVKLKYILPSFFFVFHARLVSTRVREVSFKKGKKRKKNCQRCPET